MRGVASFESKVAASSVDWEGGCSLRNAMRTAMLSASNPLDFHLRRASLISALTAVDSFHKPRPLDGARAYLHPWQHGSHPHPHLSLQTLNDFNGIILPLCDGLRLKLTPTSGSSSKACRLSCPYCSVTSRLHAVTRDTNVLLFVLGEPPD